MAERDWQRVLAGETPTETGRRSPEASCAVSPPASNGCVVYREPWDWYTVLFPDGQWERHSRHAQGFHDGLYGLSLAAAEAVRELMGGRVEYDGRMKTYGVVLGLGAEGYQEATALDLDGGDA
jgi:hypothetical protein